MVTAATAAETEHDGKPQKKRGFLGVLAGLTLAALLGAAGFYAAWSGLIPHAPAPAQAPDHGPMPTADVVFVPIPPVVISLGPESTSRHLRFTAELEVEPAMAEEVGRLMPRVLDVLNSYLRAVDARQFDAPGALVRLRAQMLRRVQVVLGEGRVRDLLVTEFVLN